MPRRCWRETGHPKVVGIGETGLDYYYEHSPARRSRSPISAPISPPARQAELPLIVHTRDADDDTIAILREEMGKGAFTGLIHCFTGTQRLADAALELGFYISVSGIATFKNSEALRDVIKTVPLDRLLVETDAPFLAPVPHRGKTNEPAFVVHTARMLAELKGVSEVELAAATTENFFRLFTKVKRPAMNGDDLASPHSGLRLFRRRAAPGRPGRGRQLGRLRSRQSQKPPHAAVPSWCAANRTEGETRVLVDTSPDLREQLLDARIGRLDGVLITHDHADQLHGMDDLRAIALNAGSRVDVWGDRRQLEKPDEQIRLLLCSAARQRLSAYSQCPRNSRAVQAFRHCRCGRSGAGPGLRPGPWPHPQPGLPLRPLCLFQRCGRSGR